ncbi:YgaP family membrane protein [Rhodosalinus sediminis]|uniref:YgaP family membrane protein n=1 Tax=Rhodosalinus sediminis TaxID=1940533 RepID=UPI0023527A5E|nr:DUF2892 domain-containing protein [Rhodosalinus sediminis]
MFETNVGLLDRIVRVIVGLALISGFWLVPEADWRWAFWLGAIPALSGALGWCPAYRLLGWSTRDDGGARA